MRPQVTRIEVGHDILILGDVAALHGLPRNLRRRSAVCGVLRRMQADPHAMRLLRHYWGGRSTGPVNGLRSDRELIAVVEAAIESGAIPALVIPDHGPHARDLQTARPGPAPMPREAMKPVAQMTVEERIWEVVRRAAAQLPAAAGEALLALITPENLAIAATMALVAAAAEATPVGWAADIVMVAVAVGFGGLAAIQGVKDLAACLVLTVNARSDRDLTEAGNRLARVIADFGVLWLMALLHERAKRGRGGDQGEASPELGRSSRPSGSRSADVGRTNTVEAASPSVPSPDGLATNVEAGRSGSAKGVDESFPNGAQARSKPPQSATNGGSEGKVPEGAESVPRSSALLTEADPSRRVMGAGKDSHPEEIAEMRRVLDEWGVEIVERPNAMAYAPGPSPGSPGQMIIDPDASYSAWLHEFQHASDDQAAGWAGMRSLFDPDNRWAMEQRAYGKEIELMENSGHHDVAEELRANMEVERGKIFGDEDEQQ